MRGTVSFHALDLVFFDELIAPLVAGEKVNPDKFLEAARRVRLAQWYSERVKQTLADLLEALEPPPPPEEGRLWDKVRARLERFDFKPDPTARLVGSRLEPDLHLRGRPFFITEGSTSRVVDRIDDYRDAGSGADLEPLIVEQLIRLDRQLPSRVEPADLPELSPDASHRSELLNELKVFHELPKAAREGRGWRGARGPEEDAGSVLGRELPWRAVQLHSQAYPFWTADDVDGLETVCQAASVEPPDVLTPAARLFLRTLDRHPELGAGLTTEVQGARSLGAFVAPEKVADLVTFLVSEGSRIIRAAAHHGEGPACETLLRKIRECAEYAQRHGMGYLEASGIVRPTWREADGDF